MINNFEIGILKQAGIGNILMGSLLGGGLGAGAGALIAGEDNRLTGALTGAGLGGLIGGMGGELVNNKDALRAASDLLTGSRKAAKGARGKLANRTRQLQKAKERAIDLKASLKDVRGSNKKLTRANIASKAEITAADNKRYEVIKMLRNERTAGNINRQLMDDVQLTFQPRTRADLNFRAFDDTWHLGNPYKGDAIPADLGSVISHYIRRKGVNICRATPNNIGYNPSTDLANIARGLV